MTTPTYVVISVTSDVARDLPTDPATRSEVLAAGLQQWRIRQALEAYRQGPGTLAYAAQQAGVSVRQIVPLAYAYGLTPKIDPALPTAELSLNQAAEL